MILFGIISGLSPVTFLHTFASFLSEVFIKLFRCLSTPILALSMIVTLSIPHEEPYFKSIGRRTLFYTVTTTVMAAVVSCCFYRLIQPPNIHETVQLLPAQLQAAESIRYWQYVSDLIPSNIFTPFLEHQVMGVLLVGICIAIAIRSIPDREVREVMRHFFKGLHGLFLVMTGWVVTVLPLGLYGFVTTTLVQIKGEINIGSIGAYLAVILLANLTQGLVILPLWLKMHRMQPFAMMRDMMPALSIAFFSKSSMGTLPITIDTAEAKLCMHPQVTRLVLPLCTTINMNGCAAFIFTTVIYLMQNQGIPITFSTMATWIVVATVAAIGNAGVPMGCFFLGASLLSSMNIPIHLLGIILPFYNLIDMVETTLNVWSDLCVASVIHREYVLSKDQLFRFTSSEIKS
ncbi:transporter [Pajaroellobacter abortibovis]|uniref:Transporter n=2 Tax=Pajaroellobacter abortibovis TaxID=1882918 RepID=A0A1L6MZE8_9BACT|nr:transporter [Pajaroellobacter abortibovis]